MSNKVTRIILERDVSVPMRDGTVLRADIYRPDGDGKYPVLLERIPYSKALIPFATLTLDPMTVAFAGYVVIIQDVRGRFQSEGGPFYSYRDEYEDGFDSVEWAASLPYSNDNVGMFGASYMGMTQFQAAVMQPPHLKAIFPVTWGTDVYMYRGGAFELGVMAWWGLNIGLAAVLRAIKARPELLPDFFKLVASIDNIEEKAYQCLPISESEWPQLGDGYAQFFNDILEHHLHDEYHQTISVRVKADRVAVPAFCVAGWYDLLLGPNLNHFQRLRATAGSDEARSKTRIIIGPWAHASFANTQGELNFGLASSGLFLELKRDFTTLHLQWFDYWLKGIDNGIGQEAPVKIFVMGENKWRDEQEWPLSRTNYVPYYLHSDGDANTSHGGGRLSTTPPGNEEPDCFIYDPQNPVPTCGGSILMPLNYNRGPLDQRIVEERQDVLVYTTLPLQREVEVTGPVKMRLYAASSALDTDFTAKLVDIYPDGRAFNLADGIIRARYRNQGENPSLIHPGEVYAYEIDLWATSNLFRVGHRIGLEISSSNFPRFDRNPNTGSLGKDSKELISASQTVFHSDAYPSKLILPIIER